MEEAKTKGGSLGFLFSAVYYLSYFTRYTYAAVLAELIVNLGVTKSQAGIAQTGFFFVYGVAQIFAGILGDRHQPKNVILFGLLGTSVVNVAMCFMSNIYVMAAVWMVNGFFQSMFWPPLVRLVNHSFKGKKYNKVITIICQACNLGTVCIYLCAAGLISISSWRIVFAVSGGTGLLFSLIWFFTTRKHLLDNTPAPAAASDEAQPKGKLTFRRLAALGALPVFAAIVINGCLRDGVSSWLTTYLNESFDFGTSFSIMSGAVIPIFGVLCLTVTAIIISKIRNELRMASIFYLFTSGLAVLLAVFFRNAIPVDILLFALIAGTMHGTNLIVIADYPHYFARYGKISTFSGILNAFVYLGSAISIYGVARLAEVFGWKITFIVWACVAVVAAVACFLASLHWSDIEKGLDTSPAPAPPPEDTDTDPVN